MELLELAKMDEIDVCMDIFMDGKRVQNEQGFIQWTEDYPNKDTIQSDIENAKGYVLKVNHRIAGYMCIDFDGEPAYADIQGEWRSNKPYAVIHRLSFKKEFQGIGLADTAFMLIEQLCIQNGISYIRADTDFSNMRMQHVLSKNGFENCGRIFFQGSEKLAFDKLL